MERLVIMIGSLAAFGVLGATASPPLSFSGTAASAAKPVLPRRSSVPDRLYGPRELPRQSLMVLTAPPEPPPPPPPTAEEALKEGVLIVVSIAAQHAYVFKGGEVWDTTKVSTGRRGNETPTGEFTILQKKKLHHSNLYDSAPMPFMQRITWDGVALHAGHVPGYPASHGCIRLPKAFAEKLYKVTNFSKTVVIVTEQDLTSPKEARALV